jgi:hypothetical protein
VSLQFEEAAIFARFHADPGRADVLIKIAGACEAASRRNIPPRDFPPLR